MVKTRVQTQLFLKVLEKCSHWVNKTILEFCVRDRFSFLSDWDFLGLMGGIGAVNDSVLKPQISSSLGRGSDVPGCGSEKMNKHG